MTKLVVVVVVVVAAVEVVLVVLTVVLLVFVMVVVDIFTAIAVFKRPYLEVIKGTPPFIFMLLLTALLLILFPQISLFLRDIAFAK